MRAECQAVLLTDESGETVVFYSGVPEMLDQFPGSYLCGKLAVDAIDALMIDLRHEERVTTEIKIHLCAEHWDQYNKEIKP